MRLLIKSLTVFTLILVFAVSGTNPANAVFNRHRLIDDSLFIDVNSMSVSQIQSFLNARGDLLADWEDEVDIYQVDNRFQVPNNRCLVHKATGMSAAQIIHQAANDWQATYVEWRYQGQEVSKNPAVYSGPVDSCSTVKKYPDINLTTISPKAILATLEKEQSLVSTNGGYSTSISSYYDPPCNVSSSSPYYGEGGCKNNNYKLAWAMGYGVPDTGGKRHQYKGFYMQVMYGSWQLRFNYEHSQGTTDWDGTGDWGYGGPKVGQATTIDGQSVTPQTRATASLYYYTPHIHGNQNFVSIYENWFGPTSYSYNVRVNTSVSINPSSPAQGETVTATFTIRNNESYEVDFVPLIKVAGRGPNGENVDFPGVSNITIAPGATYTYSQTRTFDNIGDHKFHITSHRPGFGWSSTWPASSSSSIVRSINRTVTIPDIKVTTGLSVSPTSPAQGQDVTATFTLRNDENFPVTIPVIKAVARGPDGSNVDFPSENNVTIPAGDTHTYSQTRQFDKLGSHGIWIGSRTDALGWSSTWPAKANSSIVTSLNRSVSQADIRVSVSLEATPSPALIGQNVSATFTVINNEPFTVTIPVLKAAARTPSGHNVDFPGIYFVTIPAGGTYNYSQTRSFTQTGTHDIWISSFRNGSGWSSSWPTKSNSSIIKAINLTVNP